MDILKNVFFVFIISLNTFSSNYSIVMEDDVMRVEITNLDDPIQKIEIFSESVKVLSIDVQEITFCNVDLSSMDRGTFEIVISTVDNMYSDQILLD